MSGPLTDQFGYIAGEPGAGMGLEQALSVADLATPAPALAAEALRTLRRAMERSEERHGQVLELALGSIARIRDAAGLPAGFPLADMPQTIFDMRKRVEREAELAAALRRCSGALSDGHPAREEARKVLGRWP
jgi:hypothetical protein